MMKILLTSNQKVEDFKYGNFGTNFTMVCTTLPRTLCHINCISPTEKRNMGRTSDWPTPQIKSNQKKREKQGEGGRGRHKEKIPAEFPSNILRNRSFQRQNHSSALKCKQSHSHFNFKLASQAKRWPKSMQSHHTSNCTDSTQPHKWQCNAPYTTELMQMNCH